MAEDEDCIYSQRTKKQSTEHQTNLPTNLLPKGVRAHQAAVTELEREEKRGIPLAQDIEQRFVPNVLFSFTFIINIIIFIIIII